MSQHVALIVEDDPDVAAMLAEIVASMGHTSMLATTLAEVRAAMAKGGYCYVLLDQELPADTKGRALASTGETALGMLREADARRTAAGRHVLPIIVVTGHSRDPDFVSRMYDLEADGFIAKPLLGEEKKVTQRVKDCLARAERGEHAACSAGPVTGVSIVIEGLRTGTRNVVLVNGVTVPLQDGHFAFFLRLVDAHLRTPGKWLSRHEQGIRRIEVPSRVRRELKERAGVDVVETEHGGACRLRPEVRVERVAWGELERHADPAVAKIAMGWVEKKK